MLSFKIIAINKSLPEYVPIITSYQKMIKWEIINKEITYPARKASESEIKNFEAELITKEMRSSSFSICLDERGKSYDSIKFAQKISMIAESQSQVDIIIGGAFGVADAVKKTAHLLVSLSPMTFPHQIAKLLFIEQIYRAQTIIQGHPYHK